MHAKTGITIQYFFKMPMNLKTRSIRKMLDPFATVSRRTPPVLHCHSPGVATVARRLRIDVHNNINYNNDTA